MNFTSYTARLELMAERLRQKIARRLPRASSKVAASPEKPIRLNLGCGDKLLQGYTNIDIAAVRKEIAPDLIADLRKLPLPENHADEVLAVHVIEHFYFWEVPALLGEWIRVLKPGGKLVLECPNLLSAARYLLAHPEAAEQSVSPGVQQTLWPLYGDPSWQDPLMCHRWGYTPQSLIQVLKKMGLEDVRQEPAQFKLREPRDMRVTGVRPENWVCPILPAPKVFH